MEFQSSAYPLGPGVYLMKSDRGRILYVGKAKSLRKRLASYFRVSGLAPKTASLMARVAAVDVFTTSTEKEALLLEESLIKKHRPRYNVVLRDDKRYVLFKLDKAAAFPGLFMTRTVKKDGSAYFGPFTSAHSARETWKLIQRALPLRKCKETVFKNRVRPCLYHDMKQCLAPCVLPVERETYAKLVRQAESFLRGRSVEFKRALEAEMRVHAERMEFEQAAEIRDRLAAVEKTLERQAAVLADEGDLDVVALVTGDAQPGASDQSPSATGLALCVLFVRMGRLLDRKCFVWPSLGPDDAQEALESFLGQHYGPGSFVPPAVLLPFALRGDMADAEFVKAKDEKFEILHESVSPEAAFEEMLSERRGGPVHLILPSRLEEKRLIDIAATNAREALRRRDAGADWETLAARLAEALGLPSPPERVEGVDVSHLGGSGVRVGRTVFDRGLARRDERRAYAFPELEGAADDYKAMRLFAARRVESGPPWPDLVVIDGGRGQLAAVERAWNEAGGPPEVEFVALAKALESNLGVRRVSRRAGELGDRVFRPGRKNPSAVAEGSQEMLFLQRVRDATHELAIARQRATRASAALASEVAALQGVGPKTAKLLWDKFGSVPAMLAASLEDLAALPGLGAKRAAKLRQALAALGEPEKPGS